jgi:ABC-type nitrate/sulfonate/bicarbonate transport system permease component
MELTRIEKRASTNLTMPGTPSIGCVTLMVIVVGLLLLWEYASQTELIPKLFYPPPSVVGQTLVRWFTTNEWQSMVLPTMKRLAVGFTMGALVGYITGLAVGYSQALHRVVDPILAFIYPIPKISLLPLALVVFGLGDAPRQFIIALAAFFPMVFNTATGVRTINENYFAIGTVYGARWPTVFRRILIPGSLPLAVTGMRIAFNSAFLVTVAIELNTATDGLGHVVWLAWQTLRTENLFAGIFVIALIGMISTATLNLVRRRLIRWQA